MAYKYDAEYIYGPRVETSESGKSFCVTACGERRERIVRCRDCKFSDSMGYQCRWFHGDYPTHAQVQPEGFCAWGERREA